MLSYTYRNQLNHKMWHLLNRIVPSIMESICEEQAPEGACVGDSKWLECGYEIRTLRSRAPYQYVGADQTRENCLLGLSAYKLIYIHISIYKSNISKYIYENLSFTVSTITRSSKLSSNLHAVRSFSMKMASRADWMVPNKL